MPGEAEAALKPDYRLPAQPACVSQREQSSLPRQVPGQAGFNRIRPWSLAQNGPCTGSVPPRKTDPSPMWRRGDVGWMCGRWPGLAAACTGPLRVPGPKPGLRDRCQANAIGVEEPRGHGQRGRQESWDVVSGGSSPSLPGVWHHVWCENSDQGRRKDDMRWGPCGRARPVGGLRLSLKLP